MAGSPREGRDLRKRPADRCRVGSCSSRFSRSRRRRWHSASRQLAYSSRCHTTFRISATNEVVDAVAVSPTTGTARCLSGPDGTRRGRRRSRLPSRPQDWRRWRTAVARNPPWTAGDTIRPGSARSWGRPGRPLCWSSYSTTTSTTMAIPSCHAQRAPCQMPTAATIDTARLAARPISSGTEPVVRGAPLQARSGWVEGGRPVAVTSRRSRSGWARAPAARCTPRHHRLRGHGRPHLAHVRHRPRCRPGGDSRAGRRG
jgi:hypothetical protein